MSEKRQRCMDMFRVIGRPNTKQVIEVAKTVGCCEKTAWSALKDYNKKKSAVTVKRNYSKNKKGKRGRSSSAPLAPSITQSLLPKLPKTEEFFRFCRLYSYPAYDGLLDWQQECYETIKDAKFAKIIVHRDGGKSIYLGNYCQYSMKYGNSDILYLGWTDRRKEVTDYIRNFFELHGELEVSTRNSPFHFKTKDGARFDCYLITSKETLGKHSLGAQPRFENLSEEDLQYLKEMDKEFTSRIRNVYLKNRDNQRKLTIIIDDPIDDSFRDEKHKEATLERRFKSTIYNINPDRWIFTGTRKFEGDFFDFIDKMFGKKLVKYVRGTRNPDGSLLSHERFTHPDLSTYEADLKKGKKDLQEIRDDVGEYWWHAEYEGNPHPITGEVWDSVHYENLMKPWTHYDCLFITLDRATTTNPKSSYTGYVACLREKNDERLVIDDNTGFWEFEKLLVHLNRYIIEFNSIYKNIMIFIVLEKQGGGDDFFSAIDGRPKFYDEDSKTWEDNHILKHAVIILLHTTGDKKERIKTYLYARIKNKKTKFLSALKNSELVREILGYPHGPKIDGADALANMERAIDISPLIPPLSDGEKGVADELVMGLRLRNIRKSRGYDQDFEGLIKH